LSATAHPSVLARPASLSSWRQVSRIGAVIRNLGTRWRQRRELSAMDDIELRELTLTAADAQHELRKPFWSGLSIANRG
jgi:uncharacterized protein YjiS (DUF1127 family)